MAVLVQLHALIHAMGAALFNVGENVRWNLLLMQVAVVVDLLTH
jgi:hypothetical protein